MLVIRKKLLFRLLLITLVSSTIPLLVAGIYVIARSSKGLKTNLEDRMSARVLLTGSFVQENLLKPASEFTRLIEESSPESIPQILANYPEIESSVASIFRIENTEPADTTDLFGTTPAPAVFDRLSSLPEESPGEIFLVDSGRMCIVRGNRGPGIIGVVFDLAKFKFELTQHLRSGNWSGHFVIWDMKDNQAVFDISASDAAGLSRESLAGLAFESRSANPLELSELDKPDGEDSYAMFWDLPGPAAWRVFAQLPRSAVSNPFQNIWQNFTALLVFAIMLTLLGTIYYWKKITRPLDRFARSATEIARGDFNQKIEVDSDDEIGRLARIFNYMVTELRRLHEMNLNKIITEKTKTQTIIKNIADGVIVTDNFDRVVTINSAIEDWFRIKELDVGEKPVSLALDAPGLIELLEETKDTLAEGTRTRELNFILPGHNKEIVFQARAARIVSQEEKFIGVVTVLRDITREKEIDRMKTELVSLVAHELRSPLASISGFAEILGSIGGTQEQIEEYSNIIRQEAERLAELVNKYLDLTKIEAGRMDFRPESVPIREVFDAMLYLASAQAEKKNIEISLNIEKDDCEIYADDKMMSEVLLNLLSNAIKYSPEKSKVCVEVAENSRAVNITVADQGYGIAEYHLSHIFDKFYRIKDDPRMQDERGTGLGLSLVKEIVELHGGSIKVESRIDHGTKFRISLPKKNATMAWNP